MLNDIDRKFRTRQEAERVANFYNLGSDSSTAFIVFDNGFWIIKIK